MMLTFGSLFSGIGGFDLGFERAGMRCEWQVEIDAKCRDVLGKHFQAEIFNDVKTVGKHNLKPVDVICGGFPCQDLSVAGKRAGLAGERSGLWHEFHRIITELRPGWVVIENVPGLLSSNQGRDFAVILRGLVECGYGVSWRILDAQYFGVAQRRRRVFVVASLGSGRAAEVLFEREGMFGDTAPSRQAGKDVAYTVRANPSHSGDKGDGGINTTLIANAISTRPLQRMDTSDTFIAFNADRDGLSSLEDISPTLTAHGSYQKVAVAYDLRNEIETGEISMTLQGTGMEHQSLQSSPVVAFNIQHNDGGDHKRKDRPNGGMYVNETETALTVGTTDLTAIAWDKRQITSPENRSQPRVEQSPTLNGKGEMMTGVRRLTPTECARLQGFPDDWNDWLADSTRYRQFGNAVCVNVLEWIGRRIVEASDYSPA